MSVLSDAIGAAEREAREPKPGDVWCCGAHAITYRIKPGTSFYVLLGDVTTLCNATITGKATAGCPLCATCRAELLRAAPVLAQRLTWSTSRSTCGRYRIAKQRRPEDPDYPFIVLERDPGKTRVRWQYTSTTNQASAEDAQREAQEHEFERICAILRSEARGESIPGSAEAQEQEALRALGMHLSGACYAMNKLIAARTDLPRARIGKLDELRRTLVKGRDVVSALRKRRAKK